jgi:hypothetical protein
MAQSLELNIKTTSDVPQAMDKAKAATAGFSKQVEDIGRKFGTSFKDIFLSFLGPMALLTGAMAKIGQMIADNERKRAEANQAAIDGTNELMSAEDKYWARKNERENKTKEIAEEAKVAREDVTLSFLQNDPRGKVMVEDILNKLPPSMRASASFNMANNMSREKGTQDKVQAMIAEDAAKANWEETKRKQNIAAERIRKEEEEAKAKAPKDTSFKGPEGFSNVVGVGANPVMEAMTAQLEEQRKQTALLERIANGGTPSADGWMTAPTSTAAPSRAALLRGKL